MLQPGHPRNMSEDLISVHIENLVQPEALAAQF